MLTARERARNRRWTPTEGRIEILVTLSEIFRSEELSCADALREAAVVLAEVLEDAMYVCLVSDDPMWMRPVAWHHVEEAPRAVLGQLEGRRFRADRGFSVAVLESDEPVLVPSVTPLELEVLQPDLAPIWIQIGLRGFALAPLAVRGRVIGFVEQGRIRSTPELSLDDRRFLEEVGLRLALGIASRGDEI